MAIVTAVFSASGGLGSASGVIAGVRPALTTSAGLSLLGALAALAAGRRRQVAATSAVPAPALTSARD